MASAFVVCAMFSVPVESDDRGIVDGFAAKTFVGANGIRMPDRLFVPEEKSRIRPLPAIIYLHGGGGIGTDNLKQISGGNTTGARSWVTREAQARHPAFVIAPQLPPGNRWDRRGDDGLAPYAGLVIELLESVSREFAIDRGRIYLTGQSLGGIGTWDLIAKRPDVFAAAVPLCGEGTPSLAAVMRDMPIWVFHGAKDEAVSVTGSREMVAELRAVGGGVRYCEYW